MCFLRCNGSHSVRNCNRTATTRDIARSGRVERAHFIVHAARDPSTPSGRHPAFSENFVEGRADKQGIAVNLSRPRPSKLRM
jgi:hypothetical protein